RGRGRAPGRRGGAGGNRGPGGGRPRAPGAPQPGARGAVADVVRHPAGRDEAARGAASRAAVRRAGLDDEAAAVGTRASLAGGPGARRSRAATDDPDPRIPREAARRRGRPYRLTMADRQLWVLIAPDSFKGSLTSVQVARALADGWHRARPGDDLHLAPLADGGEGTLIAVDAGGRRAWAGGERAS